MIDYVVDTDGVSGGYSTLSASFSGLPSSLSDNYTITTYASTGVPDTTVALLTAKTLNGFKISIVDGNGTYQLIVNSGSNALTIAADNTIVKDLFVENQGRRCINVTATGCIIDGCIARANNSYGFAYGIGFTGVGTSNTAQNNLVYGYGTSRLATGMTVDNGHGNLYNNVVYNCATYGVFISNDATATIKNNGIFETGDDFFLSGAATVDYNASDDGDGTNVITPSDWSAVFTDYPNFDFTLKSGSDLIGTGIGPSADSLVPVLDRVGATRSGGTTDIGAYLFVGGGIEINITATVSEPVRMTATLTQEQFISANVSEPVELSAVLSLDQFISANVSEPVELSAALSQEQFISATVSEPVRMDSPLTLDQFISATVSEPIVLSANLTLDQFISASVQELITITVPLTLEQSISAEVSEPVSMSVTLTQEQFISATVNEPIEVTAILTSEGGGEPYYETINLSFNIEQSKVINFKIETENDLGFIIDREREVKFDI